jgi:hypothetical protein
MSIASEIGKMRTRAAAANPTAQSSIIRNIELAASEAFPDDMAARFDYRNQLRAEAGLPAEKRQRGGIAGLNDKGFLLPMAAMVAAPFALGALGGGAAAAAGGLGGLVKKGSDWLGSDVGRTVTNLAGTAYGISQQAKAQDMMQGAVAADRQRWAAGAPLREAGAAGMLNPMARDTSSLDRLATQGNPFAAPMGAVPAMPAMPGAMPTGPAMPAAAPAPVAGAVPVAAGPRPAPRPVPRGGAVPVTKRVR